MSTSAHRVGPLTVALIGVALIVNGVVAWNALRSWKQTPAVVRSIVALYDGGRKKHGAYYRSGAEYTYTVDGRHYSGRAPLAGEHVTTFGDATTPEAALAESRINVGQGIQTYYNPRNPAESRLYRAIETDDRVGFVLGFFCLLIAYTWRQSALRNRFS